MNSRLAPPPSPRILKSLRRAALPGLGLTVISFFGGYAVFGANGVLAYGEYRSQMAARELRFQELDAKRAVMRNRVALLDPRHANPDMVDELVREKLNVAHPDEVIMPLR